MVSGSRILSCTPEASVSSKSPFFFIFLSALLLGGFAGTTDAARWRVNADGSGNFANIQAGIDAAASGDTVAVGPGTYPGAVWIESKDIALLSSDGAAATIIDAGSVHRHPVVQILFQVGPGSILDGFTIRGGESGVACTYASPVIRNNTLTGNTGPLGAGICCIFESHAQILNNVIVGNGTAFHCCLPSRGGGIYTDDTSAALIRGNLIAFNRCTGACNGGGISSFIARIENNTIYGNTADGAGGGIELPAAGTVISNNVIVGNLSGDVGDGIAVFRWTELWCNDIWGNGDEDYWGTLPGDSDFGADPLFCEIPERISASPGNILPSFFDLRENSPCVDGQDPGGFGCGIIGARPQRCALRASAEITAPHPLSTDSRIRIFPNPSHGGAVIAVPFPADGDGKVEIIDAGGRTIARRAPGPDGRVRWNGRNDTGEVVSSGVYFVRVTGGASKFSPASPLFVVR
jgi:hypothetical protein